MWSGSAPRWPWLGAAVFGLSAAYGAVTEQWLWALFAAPPAAYYGYHALHTWREALTRTPGA